MWMMMIILVTTRIMRTKATMTRRRAMSNEEEKGIKDDAADRDSPFLLQQLARGAKISTVLASSL